MAVHVKTGMEKFREWLEASKRCTANTAPERSSAYRLALSEFDHHVMLDEKKEAAKSDKCRVQGWQRVDMLERDAQSARYRLDCQSNLIERMGCDLEAEKKQTHAKNREIGKLRNEIQDIRNQLCERVGSVRYDFNYTSM